MIGVIAAIVALLIIVYFGYKGTGSEPQENIDARKRYGKVGHEQISDQLKIAKIKQLQVDNKTDDAIAERLNISVDELHRLIG
jgi:hypothetical protein